MQKFFKKRNSGYGLVELLFYVSVFAIVFLVIIQSILVMVSSFKEVAVNTDLVQSAQIMEKISRETKLASSYSLYNGEIPSETIGDKLELMSKNSVGEDRKVLFYFNLDGTDGSKDIVYEEYINNNPTPTINEVLNSNTVDVDSLIFKKIFILREGDGTPVCDETCMKGRATSIELTVSSKRFGIVRSATFYDTLVLRGKYENE